MTKSKILISAPYMHKEKEKITNLLSIHNLDITWAKVTERLEENDLIPIISDFDGIICGDDKITSKVLDRAKNLKVIVKWGTGIDSIDSSEAAKRNIPVYRTPGAFTKPVADTTLAFILSFSRNIFKNDSLMKDGGWDKPQSSALFEKTVGIIGFGDIGKAVAKRLMSFETRTIAYDIKDIDRNTSHSLSTEMVPFEQILEESDFITCHCDLNPSSYHLLNKPAFDKMKLTPYIINTARGPVVEESSLIEALESGSVSGAGLDVFEHEPLPVDSPLRNMQNVLLSSHNSNSSPVSWDNVHINSIDMLIKGLSNG